MAKKPSSKPALSAEEQKLRLAQLTAGIAAVPHVGPASFMPAAPAAEPASLSAAPGPDEAPATEVAATEPASAAPTAPMANEPATDQPGPISSAPDELPTPAAEPAADEAAPASSAPIVSPAPATSEVEQKGEKEPGRVTEAVESVAEQPTSSVSSEPVAAPQPAADRIPPAAVEAAEDGKFILASLFAPPSEKRTFQVRITPDLQQFFQQVGTILGNGASSADIIHNILTQFRAQHGPQIARALQKELRKMLNPKP